MRIWGDGLFVGCLPQSSVAHRAASSYGGCARGGGGRDDQTDPRVSVAVSHRTRRQTGGLGGAELRAPRGLWHFGMGCWITNGTSARKRRMEWDWGGGGVRSRRQCGTWGLESGTWHEIALLWAALVCALVSRKIEDCNPLERNPLRCLGCAEGGRLRGAGISSD